jgi:multimeric flavodoxin WrbA
LPSLLVVHHTPSPATQELLEAALAGARHPDANDGTVEVVVRPALTASTVEALEADGYLLATPANIGYVSGALKHFFDTIYYPCLEATRGRPFAAWVHGNLDSGGAVRALETITTGLQWRAVAPIVTVAGAPTKADRDAVHDLAATLAATLCSTSDG